MPVARLDPEHSAVMVIDIQERLVPVMHEKSTLVRRAVRLIEGANALAVPVLVTEQYPRGLGQTVRELAKRLGDAACMDEKTRFSACSDAVLEKLRTLGVTSVIVTGIETHVCVLQTCLDLVDQGFTVAVCQDAVSSRRPIDKAAALSRMTQAGVLPSSVESALLELTTDAGDDKFRRIRDIIRSTDA